MVFTESLLHERVEQTLRVHTMSKELLCHHRHRHHRRLHHRHPESRKNKLEVPHHDLGAHSAPTTTSGGNLSVWKMLNF